MRATRGLVGMVVAALVCTSTAVAQRPLFDAPWRAYDTGDFPTFAPAFFDLGDLNGDGLADAVASREMFSGPGLSVLFNDGRGGFGPEVIYQVAYNKSLGEVVLHDVDSDGDLDAVATIPDANGLTNVLGLWRNNGDGSFAGVQQFTAGQGPVGLVLGDLTGDGFPDVVTADNGYVAGSNDTISLLPHNGRVGPQAGFLAPIPTRVGDNCMRVAAADIDGDGDLDLAVGRGNASRIGEQAISILTNDGVGSFTLRTSFESVPGAYGQSQAVVLTDMDRDGDADLITGGAVNSSSTYGVVAIRSNDGAGNFGAPRTYGLSAWSFTPHSIATADWNGDGWPDVLASTPSGRANDGWELLTSDGAGGFRSAGHYEAAKQTFDVGALDMDGDGDLEVLTVANDSSVLTVHDNLGGGAFLVLTRFAVGALTADMDHADIDHDGDLDVVTCDGQVRIVRNNGDGTFAAALRYVPPFTTGHIRLRDMNGDGFVDVLMATSPCCPPYHFAVGLNRGDGTFMPGVVTPVFASQGGEIDAFDFDNDGDRDVVLTDPGPANRVYVARNAGDGVSFSVLVAFNYSAFGLGGADFDHDGNLDLMTNVALGLSVFPGNGDLTFDDPIPTSESAYKFVLTDFDGDENEDVGLIIPQDSFGTVFVATMLGYGDFGFAFANEFPGPNGREGAFRISSDIDVEDVNGDGTPDLVLTSNAPNDVSVFRGHPDGTLDPQERYGVGYAARMSAVADFTGDGWADVVSVISLPPSGIDNALVVLRGLGAGAPGDTNCDGVVNALDIEPFIVALFDPASYDQQYPDCDIRNADVNGDGSVNALDIEPFIGLLFG